MSIPKLSRQVAPSRIRHLRNVASFALCLLIHSVYPQSASATSLAAIGPFDDVESFALDFTWGPGLGLSSSPSTSLYDLIPGGSGALEKVIRDQVTEQLGKCGIKVSGEAGDTLMIGVWGRPVADVPTHSMFLIRISSCLDETRPEVSECISLRLTMHSAPNERLTEQITETVRDMITRGTIGLRCD